LRAPEKRGHALSIMFAWFTDQPRIYLKNQGICFCMSVPPPILGHWLTLEI